MAHILAGAWRREPPLNFPAADLAKTALPLRAAETAGLVWWRISHSKARPPFVSRQYKNQYRTNQLQAAHWQRQAAHVLAILQSSNIEPILIKGWSSARLYARAGLRPLGDIDLCVSPRQMKAAMAALKESPDNLQAVDLHQGIPDLKDRTWGQAYQRSQQIQMGSTEVRILGPEDHLRLLCLHFVRHRGTRPLWLCDVAAALEAQSADFDWEYCLHGRRRWREWVLCVVGLARELLGARIEDVTIAKQASRLPRWLLPYICRSWGDPLTSHRLLQIVYGHVLNPMHTIYRLGLGPATSLAFVPILFWLKLPQMLGRHLIQTMRRRSRKPPAFDIHPQRAA